MGGEHVLIVLLGGVDALDLGGPFGEMQLLVFRDAEIIGVDFHETSVPTLNLETSIHHCATARLCSRRSSRDLIPWIKSWLLRSHRSSHSHSIVPGGLEVMSYTTRFIPRTSLTMRVAVR